MTTYILHEYDIPIFYDRILKTNSSSYEAKIKLIIGSCYLFGIELKEYTLDEAKRIANVGDCLLISYKDNSMYIPFQILHKFEENGVLRCILGSYYLLESHMFDLQTNNWKDCELRNYLNSQEYLSQFDQNFINAIQSYAVHTSDYITYDKFWIPSHEELGYIDNENKLIPNLNTFIFDYFKQLSNNINIHETF